MTFTNKILTLLVVFLTSFLHINSQEVNNQNTSTAYSVGKGKFEGEILKFPADIDSTLNRMQSNYVVWKPSIIGEGDKLPLLIYLHGGGKVKKTVEKLKGGIHPVKYWQEQTTELPFIIAAPHAQGPWDINDLEQFFKHIIKTQPVDLSRVYLCGYSMGGAGTWNWAQAHPEHFAAIVVMSGGLGAGGPKKITQDIKKWQHNLKDMPTWIIHGAEDTTVPAERSILMHKGLVREGNVNVKLSILPDKAHAITEYFKQMPEIYPWLLSFKNGN